MNLAISFFKDCQHFGVQGFLSTPRVPMTLTHLFPVSHFNNMCLPLGGSCQGLSDLCIPSKDQLFVSTAKRFLALYFSTLSHNSFEAGMFCFVFCIFDHQDASLGCFWDFWFLDVQTDSHNFGLLVLILLFFISSILWPSQSPPEKMEDMADEVPYIHLSDKSLQASKKLALEYSISSLVNATCSLTNIVAEEKCDTTVPNGFYETLAKNDVLFQKNHIYRWKSKYYPQVCYSRGLTLDLTLPRCPLRRRWSELALPTILTKPEVKKGQEVNDKTNKGVSKSRSPYLYIRS